MALPIISACQASECILIAVMVADLDRAQGVESVVDKEQNTILRRVYRFERFEGTWRIVDERFVGPVPQLLQRQK